MATTVRPRPQLLRFGTFELDVTTGELRKEGRLIHLRHQPVQVLRLLLERSGGLVTRREITSALWPDDLDVDVEQGLNHCMKEIRAALGDRAESPRFVQTLPRRGYRFVAEVHDERLAPPGSVEGSRPETGPRLAATAVPLALPSARPDEEDVRVRVRLSMTRSRDGLVVWNETYERTASEAERLQKDLAAGLNAGLQAALAEKTEEAGQDLETETPRRDQRFE